MRFCFVIVLLISSSGCAALRQSMLGNVTGSLAESAAISFSRESDLKLAADAMPFALKTLDMLALQNPADPEIHLSAGRSYIQYSAAFLDWPARQLEFVDIAASGRIRQRAAKLHFRGRDYAATALSLKYPGAMNQLANSPEGFLSRCTNADVPTLFWLASGWAAGIASEPSNMKEMAHLGLIESIMRRCMELDPDFDNGSIYEFFLVLETTRSAAAGDGGAEIGERYYEKAVAASQGRRASPHVLMATTVKIQQQDADGYRELLNRALSFNIDADPDSRLANAIAQDKARWYLENIEEFFLLDDTEEAP